MTLHWADLIVILAIAATGFAAAYMLLLRQLKQIVSERNLKVADQIATLDDAIRALEARLAEHHEIPVIRDVQLIESVEKQEEPDAEHKHGITPEIQAVVAAASVAVLGQNAHVRSVKHAASPWSQQGRVLVAGSHNARAGR